jgi:hypothetical protein
VLLYYFTAGTAGTASGATGATGIVSSCVFRALLFLAFFAFLTFAGLETSAPTAEAGAATAAGVSHDAGPHEPQPANTGVTPARKLKHTTIENTRFIFVTPFLFHFSMLVYY